MLDRSRRLFASQGAGCRLRRGRRPGRKRARPRLQARRRDDDGFVIDGQLDGTPWRIEWGPPQRTYIDGHELRLRMELGLPPDLQMLVARPRR